MITLFISLVIFLLEEFCKRKSIVNWSRKGTILISVWLLMEKDINWACVFYELRKVVLYS